MKHLFVNYELAKKAKHAGFDEPCLAMYHSALDKQGHEIIMLVREAKDVYQEKYHGQVCSAPLYHQLVDWFRNKYCLYIEVHCCNTKRPDNNWQGEINRLNDKKFGHFGYKNCYEALTKALEESFKFI